MTRLLQLLGLLNSTSVVCENRSSCAVSAGSDMCWQLNSYRPNKKHRGIFFCVGALAQRTTHGFELTVVLSFGCGSDRLLQEEEEEKEEEEEEGEEEEEEAKLDTREKGSWVAGQPHQMQPLPLQGCPACLGVGLEPQQGLVHKV